VKIQGGKKMATVVTLILPVAFYPDAMKMQARLFPARDGVTFLVPSIPSPFYTQPMLILAGVAASQDPDECEEDYATPICQQTKNTYEVEATRIASFESNKWKTINVSFPDSMSCNNRDFNEGVEGDHALSTHIGTVLATDKSFKDENGNLLQFPMAMAIIRCVIDGTEQLARTPKKKDQTAKLNKMMRGLGIAVPSKGTDYMDVDGGDGHGRGGHPQRSEYAQKFYNRQEERAEARRQPGFEQMEALKADRARLHRESVELRRHAKQNVQDMQDEKDQMADERGKLQQQIEQLQQQEQQRQQQEQQRQQQEQQRQQQEQQQQQQQEQQQQQQEQQRQQQEQQRQQQEHQQQQQQQQQEAAQARAYANRTMRQVDEVTAKHGKRTAAKHPKKVPDAYQTPPKTKTNASKRSSESLAGTGDLISYAQNYDFTQPAKRHAFASSGRRATRNAPPFALWPLTGSPLDEEEVNNMVKHYAHGHGLSYEEMVEDLQTNNTTPQEFVDGYAEYTSLGGPVDNEL